MISLNGKLLLKPYEGEKKVGAKITGGFATVAQKSNLIGLEVLSDFNRDTEGSPIIKKGDTVYFSEEILYASDWARKTYECAAIEEKFIIADIGSAICVG